MKKFCIFHTWSKWSAIVEVNYTKTAVLHGVALNSREVSRTEQHRYCLLCNKYQRRIIN